jgi:beta-glucosidase
MHSPADPTWPYLDPDLSVEGRIDDLVARMTLQQKAAQLLDHAPAISQLGIPAYCWWNEALHGVASAGLATVFPQAIALAATFDVELVRNIATAIGREARVKNRIAQRQGREGTPFTGLNFYSPNINIYRDPRWGRGQETYGEDPHLTSSIGVAFIRGLQGDHPQYLLAAATAKHYAAHSGPERGRHSFDARVSAHDLEDTYLPAFRAAVTRGGVAAVMAAYNSVNGIPVCANHALLRQKLTGDWHFTGQVVPDCDAVRNVYERHHYAGTLPEAYALALRAGVSSVLDFEYGRDPTPLLEAVERGLLSESDLDRALRPNLRIRFRLGMLDPPERVPYHDIADSVLDSRQHRSLALEGARRSIVMLKNNGVLPMRRPRRIAVLGPLAESVRVLLGSYHGTPSRVTTVLEGLRAQFPDAKIAFEPGTQFLLDPVGVPPAALTSAAGEPGLTVEFFDSPGHSEAAVLRVLASDATYDGTERTRPAGVPANMAVRWSGFLTPMESGEYDLGVQGNSNRLFLDGRMLVDDAGPHAPRVTLTRVTLEAHRRYSITIETFPGLEQHMRLVWLRIAADAEERAIRIAQEADAIIAVVGYTAELENEEIKSDVAGFEGGDRLTLELPAPEQRLLEALKAAAKPLVIVMMSGGPISSWWAEAHADAILQCWYPGEEGGAAIAETIAGANNPAGRLPVTVYRHLSQLPRFDDYGMAGRTYRYFRGQPLYPFGYGLSFSSFRYSEITLSTAALRAGETLKLSVTVANTSELAGDEVVQLYLEYPPLPGAPLRALCGFKRFSLGAGESCRVDFDLDARSMSHVTEAGLRRVGPGSYRLSAGGGQPNGNVSVIDTAFEVDGWSTLPP